MNPFENLDGAHRLVTLNLPGRSPTCILCLVQKDSINCDVYYVLAECESRALRWRSMIRGNTVRRLRDEVVGHIVDEQPVDGLDVETIFFCTSAASKA